MPLAKLSVLFLLLSLSTQAAPQQEVDSFRVWRRNGIISQGLGNYRREVPVTIDLYRREPSLRSNFARAAAPYIGVGVLAGSCAKTLLAKAAIGVGLMAAYATAQYLPNRQFYFIVTSADGEATLLNLSSSLPGLFVARDLRESILNSSWSLHDENPGYFVTLELNAHGRVANFFELKDGLHARGYGVRWTRLSSVLDLVTPE